ncbi:MAG: response regulator transcription factor [Bacteroidetes bacterium]|jgi:two-component system response regulator DegU|nr:response regulator transcription factor [Bacteroidota bacterium]
MKKSVKLAVVDDQPLFRKGLISLLKEFPDIKVIFEAGNGKELLEQLEKAKPDVILLDLDMPGMDGIKTTELLKMQFPEVKIMVLTMHSADMMVLHLIEKGAHGFLLKDTTIEIIREAIYSVRDNGYYFNDRVSKIMVSGLVKSNKIKPSFKTVNLSEREIQVIRLLSQEYKNSEIAEKLFINIRTVDRHRENILKKINARNAVGIIMYAVKNNLLE